MRHFIYFKNPEYAKVLAERYKNSFVKETVSEIMGIYPLDHDVFLIDAHFGDDMADLCGLTIGYNLGKKFSNINIRIYIMSWLPIHYLMREHSIVNELIRNKKVEFVQLPNSKK